MTCSRSSLGDEAGFTLVEALVSLFVFSLVAAGSAAMLIQTVAAQRETARAHAALAGLQTARALLTADVAQLAPRAVRLEEGGHAPILVGGSGVPALAFVRAVESSEAEIIRAAPLARVVYSVEGAALVREVHADLNRIDRAPQRQVILETTGPPPRFEFFDGTQWRSEWIIPASGGQAPRAVALIAASERYGEVRIEALVGLGQ